MALIKSILCVLGIAAVAALPTEKIIRKTDPGPRYQHVQGPDGKLHLVDLWLKVSDLEEVARFNPDAQNVYHLFTRQNPTVSQPLLVGNNGLLGMTNYSPSRRTIVLIHGWFGSAIAEFNLVMIPAFLAAEDVNVIVVDWSAGAGTVNYVAAVANTVSSGESVARFISWLNSASGSAPIQYHLVGFSLGGHQVGITGRNLGGSVVYITALDPAGPGWVGNDNRFRESDGIYTEVIHTNAGIAGYLSTLGDVDFYPNGGVNMAGCGLVSDCSHSRAIFYMAESLQGGVFTGRRCASYLTAMAGTCILPGGLNMGGLAPKIGASGIFHLDTNAAPPFARG